MCGFAGFVDFHVRNSSRELRFDTLSKMTQALSHRGPDDARSYDDGILSLVYRRLAIVDQEAGKQPFISADRNQILVCNGEIYNHNEIRDQLQPEYQFNTSSDCEVILHGHQKWKDEIFSRLRGMFAVAHWNKKEKNLTLAVDHFGIKPLYYFSNDGLVIFSSELKAIVQHPFLQGKVDVRGGRHKYSDINQVNTIAGVSYLEPGTIVQFNSTGREVKRKYWDLKYFFDQAPYGNDVAKYSEEFSNFVELAVAEQVASDLPIALHLSGGVDSSLLAAIAKANGKDLNCFTVAERGTWLAGDVFSARNVTKKLDIPWHPVFFDYRTFTEDISFNLERLEQLIWMVESPQFDIEWVLKEELTRAIKRDYPETKILLTGQGVDEFCGGYSKRVDNSHLNWNEYINNEVIPWLNFHSDKCRVSDWRNHPFDEVSAYHKAMHLMTTRMHSYNLWHEDRTSSYHATEARLPFLDYRLVELLASIPSSLHAQLFWNKQLIRNLQKKWLKDFVGEHPKVGFYHTSDQRSIHLVIHQMAAQIIWDFYEKYHLTFMDNSDIHEFEFLADIVERRKPGFYFYSYKLLNFMCERIFQHLFSSGFIKDDGRARASQLRVITEYEYEAIGSYFQAEPIIGIDWQDHDYIFVMDSCAISLNIRGQDVDYFLRNQDEVVSHVSFNFVSPQLRIFLEKFSQQADAKTFSYWLTSTKVRRAELVSTLNVFCQCGFIVAPR